MRRQSWREQQDERDQISITMRGSAVGVAVVVATLLVLVVLAGAIAAAVTLL